MRPAGSSRRLRLPVSALLPSLSVSPPALGLGGFWIALVVLIPIVLFGLVVYSVYTLRKPENWEQR
jgi:hypothetical protein